MGRPLKHFVGQRFQKLIIVAKHPVKSGHDSHWLVRCDCGVEKVLTGGNLRHTFSCGCVKLLRGKNNPSFKHGMTGTVEHGAYRAARSRCHNQKSICYPQYGGRGIKFLFESFEQWFAELGKRPSPQHSVERIDNDGHYAPGNVCWATKVEQIKNRRKFGTLSRFSDKEIANEVFSRTPEYGICSC